MSTQNEIYRSDDIQKFYKDRLADFGVTAKGVGWKDTEAQHVRFDQLLKVIENKVYSLNDLGCGVGELFSYLKQKQLLPANYYGYDILPEMINKAKSIYANEPQAIFKTVISPQEMEIADYSVESGIFNVKYTASETKWMNHVLTTLDHFAEKSRLGFSFNLLTKYSDNEFMQDYLYYADPLFYFDFCKRNYSKNVALLHDYRQYDFTIIVRLN